MVWIEMINEDIFNSNDYELIMLYRENDEQAKNILYLKYKYIINLIIKKYSKYLIMANIDYQEIYSECSVAFSDALKSFQDDKDASLPTFITLCIERKMHTVIRKFTREKYNHASLCIKEDFKAHIETTIQGIESFFKSDDYTFKERIIVDALFEKVKLPIALKLFKPLIKKILKDKIHAFIQENLNKVHKKLNEIA